MPGNEALVRNARERPELVSVPEKTEFAGAYRLNSQPRDVLIYSLLCKFNDLRLLQEILFLGESESICREIVALPPPGRNRVLGSVAILPASLARPFRESESICRETVALFPSPVQTRYPSPPLLRGTPCHSRLLRCLPSAEIRFTPRPCKPDGLHWPVLPGGAGRPRTHGYDGREANANEFALLSASMYFCTQKKSVMVLNGFLYIVRAEGDGANAEGDGAKAWSGGKFRLSLLEDCPVFKGHFPGFPVLPGASIIEIVRELASGMAGREICFSAMRSVKFMKMISPEDSLFVTVDMDTENSSLHSSVSVNGEECVKINAVFNYPDMPEQDGNGKNIKGKNRTGI